MQLAAEADSLGPEGTLSSQPTDVTKHPRAPLTAAQALSDGSCFSGEGSQGGY